MFQLHLNTQQEGYICVLCYHGCKTETEEAVMFQCFQLFLSTGLSSHTVVFSPAGRVVVWMNALCKSNTQL